MSSNLLPSPNRNLIQGALALEPREHTLDCLPLFEQRLSFKGVLYAVLGQQFLVGFIQLNYRSCSILPFDKGKKLPSRITGISNDVARVKFTSCKPRFPKNVGRPLRVVNVACAHIGRNGQFVFTVNQEVQFPTVGKFFGALSPHLDRPTSLRVSLLGFATVAPCLEGCAVQGHAFPETRQGFIMLPSQSARNVFDARQVFGQLPEESAESGLVGYSVRGRDAASFGNERVIVEHPNHCRRGRQAQGMLHHETSPEGLDGVSFGAASDGTFENFKQSSIFKVGEDAFKLVNDWGSLRGHRNSGIMERDHGKKQPSFGSGAGRC